MKIQTSNRQQKHDNHHLNPTKSNIYQIHPCKVQQLQVFQLVLAIIQQTRKVEFMLITDNNREGPLVHLMMKKTAMMEITKVKMMMKKKQKPVV